MPQPEHHDFLSRGSGQGGKRLAWHLARSGKRVVVVERRWVGGSCPFVACLPSKNEIWSARIAHLVRHAAQFGIKTGAVAGAAGLIGVEVKGDLPVDHVPLAAPIDFG